MSGGWILDADGDLRFEGGPNGYEWIFHNAPDANDEMSPEGFAALVDAIKTAAKVDELRAQAEALFTDPAGPENDRKQNQWTRSVVEWFVSERSPHHDRIARLLADGAGT